MTDYPLGKTQIIWDAPDDPDLPPAALVQIPGEDDRRYIASWGACNSDFKEADDDEKLVMLLRQFIHMTVNYDINAKELHEVFMQIPEYRRDLAENGIVDPKWAPDAED